MMRTAFEFIEGLFANDKRKDGTPTVGHFYRALENYLELTARKSKKITIEDVLHVLLHDAIEDHPECMNDIYSKFGRSILQGVLTQTKRKTEVVQELVKFRTSLTSEESCAFTSDRILDALRLYRRRFMYCLRSMEMWSWLQDQKKRAEEGTLSQANLDFFYQIADMSEDDFEKRCADRFDNLDHLDSVLLEQVEKNIVSTQLYLLKADVLQRADLSMYLQEGMKKLLKKKRAIEESLRRDMVSYSEVRAADIGY